MLRLGDPWRVRVVPNRYPALDRQEVVVHDPRHVRSLTDLAPERLDDVAEAWRLRAAAASEAGYPYVHAFVNEGKAAGSSLPHSHSQLLWLRGVPPAVVAERGRACGVCALLDAAPNVVAVQDGVVALCPPAGRAVYETLVAPTGHGGAAFGGWLEAGLALLARVVRGLRAVEGPVPWNAWLHGAGHPHLELVPRLTPFAGAELGAGIWMVEVGAEDAAAALVRALAP